MENLLSRRGILKASGPAVYLRDGLNPSQRAEYAVNIQSLTADIEKISPELRSPTRVRDVDACLQRARLD